MNCLGCATKLSFLLVMSSLMMANAATEANFTFNPLPSNVTVDFLPIAAPLISPWWTSVIGGIISFLIAIYNVLNFFDEQSPDDSKRLSLPKPKSSLPSRLANLFGLIFTFVQSVTGLLHLAAMAKHIDRVQQPTGGQIFTIFAALGSVASKKNRSSRALYSFAIVNAVLSISLYALLVYLPRVGTASLWQISSNACIIDFTDVGSAIYNFTSHQFHGNYARNCINSNATALAWGTSPYNQDSTFVLKIGTTIYLYVAILFFTWISAVQIKVWTRKSQEYTPVNNEFGSGVSKIKNRALILWGLAPYFLYVLVLAGFTWFNAFEYDKLPFNVVVSVCPAVSANASMVATEALKQCLQAGFTKHLPTVGQEIKMAGISAFLRVVSNM